MMTRQTVEDYLDRLDRELADLPDDRRRELIGEIRGHIAEALASIPDPSEADVRNVLDRLGEPAEIAAEASNQLDIPHVTPSWRDWAAVVLLPFGALLFAVVGIWGVLGWVLGAILPALLVDLGRAGTRRSGLLLVPGPGLALPVVLLNVVGEDCSVARIERPILES